jgi:hypothetical protein
MAAKEKVEFLRKCLDEQIIGFGKRRQANRNKAFRLRIAVVCCGAVTTILLGLHSVAESWQSFVKDCALIFSALVTVVGAFDAFYNHRALWIRYTVTYTQLKTLDSRLEYLTAGGLEELDDTEIDRLFTEFQQVLNETNANWLQLRKETQSKPEG